MHCAGATTEPKYKGAKLFTSALCELWGAVSCRCMEAIGAPNEVTGICAELSTIGRGCHLIIGPASRSFKRSHPLHCIVDDVSWIKTVFIRTLSTIDSFWRRPDLAETRGRPSGCREKFPYSGWIFPHSKSRWYEKKSWNWPFEADSFSLPLHYPQRLMLPTKTLMNNLTQNGGTWRYHQLSIISWEGEKGEKGYIDNTSLSVSSLV